MVQCVVGAYKWQPDFVWDMTLAEAEWASRAAWRWARYQGMFTLAVFSAAFSPDGPMAETALAALMNQEDEPWRQPTLEEELGEAMAQEVRALEERQKEWLRKRNQKDSR